MSAAALVDALRESQARGFLGPGPVESHLDHSERLAGLIDPVPSRFLDLGSGGGVPGLVLAQQWATSQGVLVDANQRRCEWLEEAIARLGWSPRVSVRCGRAEELARVADLREAFPLVVARAFGPPPATAECAVAFLASGGTLAVSEPPVDAPAGLDRWPEDGLASLGLGPAQVVRDDRVGVVLIQRTGELSARWPRRVGVPTKRPMWKPVGTSSTS